MCLMSVTDLQSAFQSLREQIAEVSAGREELDHRLSTLERAAGDATRWPGR